VPNDSATISSTAGFNLAGSVEFKLYKSTDCSGTAIYSTTRSVSGASPQTVSTTNAGTQQSAQLATANFSWLVSYDSTNSAQRDMPASCHETSAWTIRNGVYA